MERESSLDQVAHEGAFDVAILGGGVNGARVFDLLCRRGYRVLLLERGDIASGSSQASGMMIWGGLLYLRSLDLPTVYRLSRSRDLMLRRLPREVRPEFFRFVTGGQNGASELRLRAGLWLYWMIGLGRRQTPRHQDRFDEQELLRPGVALRSFLFEEGTLVPSDCRFVSRWIVEHGGAGRVALTYCDTEGAYNARDGLWRLRLKDRLGGRQLEAGARLIVNCAGVWADAVNGRFGIESPWRHALSKGVYLVLRRPPEHRSQMIFDLGENDDVITWVPWGPVSLWGPTETAVADLDEGFTPRPADVAFLVEHFNRRFTKAIERDQIVALRCGVRPLAVRRGFSSDCHPLRISRRQIVHRDRDRPWITCYGGKITGCDAMAERVLKQARGLARPSGVPPTDWEPAAAETGRYPGMPGPVPSARWCREHELCCTLEDYLRRRTTISQWVPRQGLGRDGENEAEVRRIAMELAAGDRSRAEADWLGYRDSVRSGFDELVAGV